MVLAAQSPCFSFSAFRSFFGLLLASLSIAAVLENQDGVQRVHLSGFRTPKGMAQAKRGHGECTSCAASWIQQNLIEHSNIAYKMF